MSKLSILVDLKAKLARRTPTGSDCPRQTPAREDQDEGSLAPLTILDRPHGIPEYAMRISLLTAILSLALCGVANADGEFIMLPVPELYISQVSGNGAYAVGAIADSSGYRWTASTGELTPYHTMNGASGVNNAGTLAGSLPENGGAENGGRDLGAYVPLGGTPTLLTQTLQTNSSPYAISDEGTVVGLSFDDNFAGSAVAFKWTGTEGMTALAVPRPHEYSRANVISGDGRVIAGWNDSDEYGRANIIWRDGVPMCVTEPDGWEVGEADAISHNGEFVAGADHMSEEGEFGAWRWSEKAGLTFIPDMDFAFGVTDDGKTVIGSAGFFNDYPRAAMIWREGIGTMMLADFLAEQNIAVPDGWDPVLAGGFGGISSDGSTMAGFAYGPLGEIQSFIIRLDTGSGGDDIIFASGFEDK